jgi:hypothetical protein
MRCGSAMIHAPGPGRGAHADACAPYDSLDEVSQRGLSQSLQLAETCNEGTNVASVIGLHSGQCRIVYSIPIVVTRYCLVFIAV